MQKERLDYLEQVTEAGSLIVHELQQKRTTVEKWSVLAKECLLNEALIEEVLATVSHLQTVVLPAVKRTIAEHVQHRRGSHTNIAAVLLATRACGKTIHDIFQSPIDLNLQVAPNLSLLH